MLSLKYAPNFLNKAGDVCNIDYYYLTLSLRTLRTFLLWFEESMKRFAHQEWKNFASSLIIPTQVERYGSSATYSIHEFIRGSVMFVTLHILLYEFPDSGYVTGVENGEKNSEFLVFSVICSNHKNIS